MTASEIIQLMEAAAKYGVQHFRSGDLEFSTAGYKPAQLNPLAQALADIEQESQDALEWANAEPPPAPAEDM